MAAETAGTGLACWLRRLSAAAALAVVTPVSAQPPVEAQAGACLACHGPEVAQPETPLLHGQPMLFLMIQLVQFRQGQRGEGTPMAEVAAALGDQDIRALARHFSALPPARTAAAAVADPEQSAQGAALAKRHRCGSCHLPGLTGREQMPRLAGQKAAYLLKAMRDYRAGARIGSGATMPEVMAAISDAEAADLAHYMASLP